MTDESQRTARVSALRRRLLLTQEIGSIDLELTRLERESDIRRIELTIELQRRRARFVESYEEVSEEIATLDRAATEAARDAR